MNDPGFGAILLIAASLSLVAVLGVELFGIRGVQGHSGDRQHQPSSVMSVVYERGR